MTTAVPTNLAEALALLPDNVQGEITAEKMRAIVTYQDNEHNEIRGLVAQAAQDASMAAQDVDSLRQTVTQLSESLSTARNDIWNLQQELSTVTAQLEANTNGMASMNTDMNALEARVQTLEQA